MRPVELEVTFPMCSLRLHHESLQRDVLRKPVYFAIEEDELGKPRVLVATRSDEFDMRRATPEEKKGFEASDLKEWQSVTGMNAVKVWKGQDARDLRNPMRTVS